RMPWHGLMRTFLNGTTPELGALSGWEFRGINRFRIDAIPRIAGIKRFIKGFFQGEDGRIMGYNRRVASSALDGSWEDVSRRFAFYEARAVDPTARDNAFLHAVLIDYDRGGNPRHDLSRGLRDYLVQADPADPDLYLGLAYYALGPVRI